MHKIIDRESEVGIREVRTMLRVELSTMVQVKVVEFGRPRWIHSHLPFN